VILAEWHDVPVVQMSMEFWRFPSDQASKGTASFTMGMLDEGAASNDDRLRHCVQP
jgi:hypothetical protein